MKIAVTMVASMAMAAGALAQVGTGVTLTAGTLTFKQADWPTTNNVAATGFNITSSDRFRISDLGASGSNHMGANMWFYRIGSGLIKANNFNNATLITSTANSASWSFALPSSISAVLSQSVSQAVAQTGQLDQTMVLTNNGALDATIQIFNFAKYHAFVPASNAVAGNAGLLQGKFTPSALGYEVTTALTSATSTRFQIDPSSTGSGVLNSLVSTNLYNLNNSISGNASSQNPMGALQWQNLFIPAGGSVTIASTFSVTPAPGAIALLGLGGLVAGRRRR